MEGIGPLDGGRGKKGPAGIRVGPAEDSCLAELPSHGAIRRGLPRTLRLLRWRTTGNPEGRGKKAGCVSLGKHSRPRDPHGTNRRTRFVTIPFEWQMGRLAIAAVTSTSSPEPWSSWISSRGPSSPSPSQPSWQSPSWNSSSKGFPCVLPSPPGNPARRIWHVH